MDPNNAANQAARMWGAVFGAVLVGVLCGLIPLTLGQRRDRPAIGWVGFVLCVVSGFLLGLIGALPMAGLMSLVIVLVGPPAKKPRPVGRSPKIRTPTPQSYDL
jgi:hypothetical protein